MLKRQGSLRTGEEWRAAINGNLHWLCDLTTINTRLLDTCAVRGVITKDEADKNDKEVSKYEGSSLFYKTLLTKDRAKFVKYTEIIQEDDTRQSDDVINKLLDCLNSNDGESGKNRATFGNYPSTASTTNDVEENPAQITRNMSISSTTSLDLGDLIINGHIKELLDELRLPMESQGQQIISDHEKEAPDCCQCFGRICEFLSDIGRYKVVLDICIIKIQLEVQATTQDLEARYYKGLALLHLKRKEEALNAFQSVQKLHPIPACAKQNSLIIRAKLGYAYALSELGRNRDACKYLGNLPTELEKSEGADNALTIRAKLYQSIINSRGGLKKDAIDLCKSVLDTQQRLEGEELITMETKFHLAVMLMDSRKYEEAMNLFDQVYRSYENQLGFCNPKTLIAGSKVAQALSAIGQNVKAANRFVAILGKLEEAFVVVNEDALKIRRNYAQVLSRLGDFPHAEKILLELLDNLENHAGIEHQSTLETKYYIGVNHKSSKNFEEAFVRLSEVGKTQTRTLGKDHPSTLRTRSDIYGVKSELGKCDNQLLKDYDELINQQNNNPDLGINHPDTLRTRRFRAQTLAKLGKFNEAKRELEDILHVQEEVMSSNHPSTLETKHQLGVAHRLAKDSEAALAILQSVYNDLTRWLGPNHPSTLITQMEIAITQSDLTAEQDRALKNIDEVFKKHVDGSKLSSFDLHIARMYKGIILWRTGKPAEGLTELNKVLESQEAGLGIDNPATIETKYHIGIISANIQDHDNALLILMEVIRAQKRVYGSDHPKTLQTKTDLAREYSEVGRNDKANDIFKEIIDKFPDKRDIRNLRTQRYQAMTKSRLGLYDDALGIFQKVADLQEDILGPEHPALLKTYYQIGATLKKLDNIKEAENKWKQVLKIQLNKFSKNHPDTLRTKIAIAGLLDFGKPDEGLEKLKMLIEESKIVFGDPDHKHVLKAKRLYAQLLSVKDHVEAIKQLQIIHGKQTQIFGMIHPITLETIYQIGVCQMNASLYDEALITFQDLLKIQKRDLGNDHASTLRTSMEIVRLETARSKSLSIKRNSVISLFHSKKK